jgi:diguanylate cyclase (GGDEF)-like protein
MDGDAAEDATAGAELGAEKARILLVDDSESMRELVKAVLMESHLKAEVMEAKDGATGARMALSEDIECVLCDLQMPVMDGLGFLRVVRRTHNRLALPVLLLTASEQVSDKLNGFRAGASDYINKPCEPAELVARTEAHVTLTRMHRRLAAQADMDPLTGLLNRRSLQRSFDAEAARASRTGNALGMLLLDIDHFKHINDQHGHPVGDAVLKDLGKLMRSHLRPYDVVSRMGGEEFAVLLPGADLAQALAAAERLRLRVESVALGGLPQGAVTASLGAVSCAAKLKVGFEVLYKQVDENLYAAKQGGRNRTVARALEHAGA